MGQDNTADISSKFNPHNDAPFFQVQNTIQSGLKATQLSNC